jgi:hypothetical protein
MGKILNIPQRFALVSKSWAGAHSSNELAIALDLDAGTLSRWATGRVSRVQGDIDIAVFAEKYGKYLSETGALMRRGLGQKEFVRLFATDDDFEFIRRLIPVDGPASLKPAGDNNISEFAARLMHRLSGHCLLYRLGTRIERSSSLRKKVDVFYPVLRAVPARIIQTNNGNGFVYNERYQAGARTVRADCQVEADNDKVVISGVSSANGTTSSYYLIHLSLPPVTNKNLPGPVYFGVSSGEGDRGEPSAQRVILHSMTDWDIQDNLGWDEFSEQYAGEFPVLDKDNDGRFKLDPKIYLPPDAMEHCNWIASKLCLEAGEWEISPGRE